MIKENIKDFESLLQLDKTLMIVVGVLSDSANPRDYWYKMKIRVKDEAGFELSTICRQLKIESSDGKNIQPTNCLSPSLGGI